jgi:predicted nucleic acid-binding protein
VTSGVAGDDDGSLAGPPVCTVSDVARYVIDARTLLRVVADDVVVDPVHQLVAPNLIRSHALDLLFADVRDGILDEQEALRRHERMTELKMRLLGDRVSRRTAWRIAMAHGWDTTLDAEYLAVCQLQADAFVTVDSRLAAMAEGIVQVEPVEVLSIN